MARAADDFSVIRARMEELRRERDPNPWVSLAMLLRPGTPSAPHLGNMFSSMLRPRSLPLFTSGVTWFDKALDECSKRCEGDYAGSKLGTP